MLLNLRISKIKPNAVIPTWGSTLAAGADLYACLDTPYVNVPPNTTCIIPYGIKTEFDPGHVAMICARSGLSIKQDLAPANKVGIIDADYRGEWCVALHNHGKEIRMVQNGDRIAQVMFFEVDHPAFIEVNESELSMTDRGEGKFGSTGK